MLNVNISNLLQVEEWCKCFVGKVQFFMSSVLTKILGDDYHAERKETKRRLGKSMLH